MVGLERAGYYQPLYMLLKVIVQPLATVKDDSQHILPMVTVVSLLNESCLRMETP